MMKTGPHKRLVVTVLCLVLLGANLPFSQAQQYALEDRITAAQNYMQYQQWDFASYQWRQVLEADPKHVEANLGLAYALDKGGFHKEALLHLANARKINPDPKIVMTLGEMLVQAKLPQQAVQVFKSVLTEHPDEPRAYQGLRKALDVLPKKNRAALQKQLVIKANEAKFKAKQALQAGRFDEAARYFEISSMMYKKVPTVNDLGLSLLLAGKRSAAKRQYARILKPGSRLCQVKANEAMVLLSLGRQRQAEKLMEETLGSCANAEFKPQLYNNLGYIYETGKRWSQAQAAYERAVALNPAFTKAQMNLAFIYQRQHQIKKAIALYKAILQREPANADVWNQLGFVYELDYEYKRAIDAYKRAIERNPDLRAAYYNLGALYKKQDQMEEASVVLKQLSDLQFAAMEAQEKPEKKGESPQKPEILKYVNVFFSHTVL